MATLLKVGLLVVVLGWLALFLSGYGILLGEERIAGPSEGVPARLECTYFTGAATFREDFLHNPYGLIGRPACPRWRKA